MNGKELIYSSLHSVPLPVASESASETVPLAMLLDGEAVRLRGTCDEHVRLLAESGKEFPPILVHLGSMRVIDGMHRLAAAKSRGRATIQVRYFEGSPEDAFVEAVRVNSAHGLPLTLADRKAAAGRILRDRGEWSDRRIAALVGLSPKTVGAIRGRLSEEFPQLTARTGRDGRVRRLPTGEKAFRAGPATPDGHPGGPPGAAPAPTPTHEAERPPERPPGAEHRRDLPPGGLPVPPQDTPRPRPAGSPQRRSTVDLLRQDPSLRMTEAGRALLRLLDLHLGRAEDWDRLVEHVPPHRVESVADLAWECARAWADFAQRVAGQGTKDGGADL
ncbi:hypothetical protein ACIQOU_17115 [Streptomyces sp. NPDC091279]|uniref:hypothetical protein n=1 Tax=Streptomyces sp. NPDC091279 TaxID=3365983 RepID=UPI00380907B0